MDHLGQIDREENLARMRRGELYYAFTPDLVAVRSRCTQAVNVFNDSRDVTRRRRVELWREITQNTAPLPPLIADDPEADARQFETTDGWIEPPLHADCGYNVHIAPGAFVNFNATFIDTCDIYIGTRTLVGPNVQFFSGTHPIDPAVRAGLAGPETGGPIWVEEDCWIGGGSIILPNIRVGRGSTVGAGSVVTKNVPPFHVVAGNPARIIRKIVTQMDPEQQQSAKDEQSKDS